MTLDELTSQYLDSQPDRAMRRYSPHTMRLARRAAFRCVVAELPAFQADLDNGLTTEQSEERLQERATARFHKGYGFLGITLAVVLVIVIESAIGWAVWWVLDHIKSREELQALAAEADRKESEE